MGKPGVVDTSGSSSKAFHGHLLARSVGYKASIGGVHYVSEPKHRQMDLFSFLLQPHDLEMRRRKPLTN